MFIAVPMMCFPRTLKPRHNVLEIGHKLEQNSSTFVKELKGKQCIIRTLYPYTVITFHSFHTQYSRGGYTGKLRTANMHEFTKQKFFLLKGIRHGIVTFLVILGTEKKLSVSESFIARQHLLSFIENAGAKFGIHANSLLSLTAQLLLQLHI